MRQQQKSNRARGRGNRKGGGGGNNVNRVYESAGPEGKVRGTPQQIMDKYLSLARDAQTSGDRVTAENFLQHAEHYQRILIQALGSQAERREANGDESEDESDAAQETARVGDDEDAPADNAPAAAEGETPAPSQNRRRRGSKRSEQAAEPVANGAAADAPPIEGLTTIDTAEGAGELLVSTEEISSSQPRRRASNGHAAGEDVPGESSHGASETEAPNVID